MQNDHYRSYLMRPLPDGRGSVNTGEQEAAFLSRARKQAVWRVWIMPGISD